MSEPSAAFIMDDPSSPSTTTAPSSSSQHRRVNTSLFLKCFVVVSLVANAVLVTMVVLQWSQKKGQEPKSPTDPPTSGGQAGVDKGNVCFSCAHLGPDIQSEDTLYDVIRQTSGNTMCCLREKNNVTTLFQKMIQDQYKSPHTEIRSLSPLNTYHRGVTGAHIYMRPNGGSVPRWTTSDPYNTAFCSGVACREGNITISEEGNYLVYSHVTVRSNYNFFCTRQFITRPSTFQFDFSKTWRKSSSL